MTTRAKLKTAPTRAEKPKRARPKPRWRRIQARVTSENLKVIERAAEIQGRDVNDFLIVAAVEAAHRAIEETHIIRLTVEQHEQFMRAIESPPPLAPAMERAMERHRRLIREP